MRMTRFPRETFISPGDIDGSRPTSDVKAGFFVTGTDTGVGKTLVTVAAHSRAGGARLAYRRHEARGGRRHGDAAGPAQR